MRNTRFFVYFVCLLAIASSFAQDPPANPYSQTIETPANITNDSVGDFEERTWEEDVLVPVGKCSAIPNSPEMWMSDSICNGTSNLSCMPSWNGKITFQDLTPEGSTSLTLQFFVIGSFGCGTSDGYVNYTLNGNNIENSQVYIFRANEHCGCAEEDQAVIPPVTVPLGSTVEQDGIALTYNQGGINEFAIVADPGVNICSCGISVVATYYGDLPPLEPEEPVTHNWILITFGVLFLLGLVCLIIAAVVFFILRKRRDEFDVESFDTEFADE